MALEVAPDLFRLPIPLPGNPLGHVNAYAIRAPDGIYLADCGWNTPEASDALTEQLEGLGGVDAVRQILITHIHPDHYGLAEQLVRRSGARTLMHELEAVYIGARYGDVRSIVEQMASWLRVNGVPPGELEAMSAGSLEMVQRVGTRPPDILLRGDEVLHWGNYHLEVRWTPGHSAGLVCLYDAAAHILISSDHVLERISPHVGLHAQSFGNPLAEYLRSLDSICSLPARLVLPGHGEPFGGLEGRVQALQQHHHDRLDAICHQLSGGELTAYQLAQHMPWKGRPHGWDTLAPFERRMAVTEVIAHLEYLASSRQIGKRHHDGAVAFGRTIR